MEVVIDRDAFLKGLQMVQNIVEPRQTLPILANVLLESDSDAVRVTATDLEVGARVAIPAKVASKGAITVSARKLAEIVKEDRKSTRLNSSHLVISYAVFCLKKKKKKKNVSTV